MRNHFFILVIDKIKNMRVVIQRVSEASVSIEGKVKSAIKKGLLVLVGIEDADTLDDINFLVKKITQLRIFDDESGVMNLSVKDVDGDIIVVSQFTLHASTKKGNRPSYIRASKPDFAIPVYEQFVAETEAAIGKKVGTGEFGAMMKVALVNDGPVTIIIDSKQKDF
jgi:D-tyrosyl-tRNA(Tyr) deacylase